MSIIHAAGRRPIVDARSSAAAASRGASAPARTPTYRPGIAGASAADGGAANGGGNDHHAVRDADFDLLIGRAIEAILAAGDRADPVFGAFAELNSLVRAVTYHEGKLLEYGVARLAAENPSLTIMPPEAALPIVPAAVEMLKRNDWTALKGIRLRSEVHYRTSYAPDHFIVDRDRHSALILDMKRSLNSYPERRLNALRNRMMAAALIAGDWLHIEGRVAGVSKVDVAIIDGSSERRDRASGVFALDEIGELIGVADAGEAMLQLRAKFACRVQQEMRSACVRAIGDCDGLAGACAIADEGPDRDVIAGEEGVDQDEVDLPADDDDDEPLGSRGGAHLSSGPQSSAAAWERRPIVVGFASGGPP